MNYLIETEHHLPSDFADRLVAHVRRRRRRALRLRILVVLAILIAASTALMGFLAVPPEVKEPGEARLIASRTDLPKEEVTGWMLLGVFRECVEFFRKPSKKKEEK